MTNLETKLNENKVKEIALILAGEKNLCGENLYNVLSRIQKLFCSSKEITQIYNGVFEELDSQKQLVTKESIAEYFRSIFLGRLTDSVKQNIDFCLKNQEGKDYYKFRDEISEPIVEIIQKIHSRKKELENIIINLTNQQFAEYESLRRIDYYLLAGNPRGKFDSKDRAECKKAIFGLVDMSLNNNLQKDSRASKLVLTRFLNLLNNSGLDVKLRKNRIKKGPILAYLNYVREQKEKEISISLQSSNVDRSKLETADYELVFDGKPRYGGKLLDAYAIGQDFLKDFIQFGERVLTTNRQKDALAIARQMVIDKKFPGYEQVKSVLSKDRKIILDNLTAIFKNKGKAGEEYTPQFNMFGKIGALVDTEYDVPHFIFGAMQKNGLYLVCRDILITDLLDGIGMLGKDFRKFYDDIALFWEKFKPLEFDLQGLSSDSVIPNMEESYRLKITKDNTSLAKAVEASGACLDKEDVEVYIRDPTTYNILGYEDNKPVGYTRMFLTKNSSNEPGLAIDTIEIGHKDFEANSDWVRIMALAANQLCLDANLRFVVGSDSRVAYGVRQGFGNKKISAEFTKIGEPDLRLYNPNGVTSPYTFKFNERTGKTPKMSSYLLMQNWRKNLV